MRAVRSGTVLLAGGGDALLDELRAALIARGVDVEQLTVEEAAATRLPELVVCDARAAGIDAVFAHVGEDEREPTLVVLGAQGEIKRPATTRGRAAVLAWSIGVELIAVQVAVLAGAEGAPRVRGLSLARPSSLPRAPFRVP